MSVPNPGDEQALVFFFQYGHAEAEVMEVEHHLAFGLDWVGLFPGRDADRTGFYCSFVDLVEKAGYTEDEIALELYHRFQITPFFALQPDLQYVIDAGGASEDAVAASLRLEIVF
ncbi:MAG: carbohydrate porin [Planctomycetes bacterium]|nr:carbohydrate porin [Planctomycetota bacterium]